MTSSWTKEFIDQLSDREFRHAYMADQVRTHIALAIRILREQEGREWSQTELGKRCDKPQSWISKLEDPEYGKVSLQTLLEIAEAFDLPLLVQFPEWSDWLRRMKNQSRENFEKRSFDADLLNKFAATKAEQSLPGTARTYSYSKYAITASGNAGDKLVRVVG
ncbi:helix-turn-helix domain-containing protein [Bradyrhizobium sp. USDA 3256]